MRTALTPEALLALKAFGDLVLYVIEHRVDDYWDTDRELENLVDDLLNNSVVFDDPQSSKSIEFFQSFPVTLEVIKFCADKNIPLIVSLRFPYGGGSSKDNLDFLKEYAENKLTEYQKKTMLPKLESLRSASERECFVSADKEAWLFGMLSMLASTAAQKVREERNSKDFIKFITTADKKNSSLDSDFLLRLKSFISLPAEKQSHDFPWKVQKAISAYLRAMLNSELEFPQPVLAWKQQLEQVNSVLEQQSRGHNKFIIDPSCFATRTKGYEKMIPSDYRPIECLLVLEERGDIAFEGMEKMDDEEKGVILHLTYLANDWLKPKTEPIKIGAISAEAKLFRFGKSVTNFESYRIWKDGDEQNGQSLSDAKRRYIWEFCSKNCDKGLQSQKSLDLYVQAALKKKGNAETIRVTEDDMKTLIGLVAQFSDVPKKTLREHIKFKKGVGIEVKTIS